MGRTLEDSEENVVPEMGDVGGCDLAMCDEVSWEEVVEVMKCLKRGKASSLTEF